MPNPPLPLPATTIQAAWGQDVTTRVVNVYQNAAARDAAIPTPEDGQLAYLLDEDILTVRIAGVLWVTAGVGTFVQVTGDSMTGKLDANGGIAISTTGLIEGGDADFDVVWDATTGLLHRRPRTGPYLPLTGGGVTGELHVDGGISISNPGITEGGDADFDVVWDATTGLLHRRPRTGPYLPLTGGKITGKITLGQIETTAAALTPNGTGGRAPIFWNNFTGRFET